MLSNSEFSACLDISQVIMTGKQMQNKDLLITRLKKKKKDKEHCVVHLFIQIWILVC